MAAKPKTKIKAGARNAAQSREEVENLIASMGEAQRELARLQANYGDQAAVLKAEYEAKAQEIGAAIQDQVTRIQGWCEANRLDLTQDGKVKFADFATGKVQWRSLPPKVTIRGVEKMLEEARRLGLTQFIRTKLEPNKDVMLAEPALAQTLPGVTIASAGEEFAVEPFQAEIVAAA